MDTIRKFLAWLIAKPITTKVLFVVAFLCCLVAVLFFGSCSVARSSVSGDRVVDKNVKDSTHYEVVVEK